MMKNVGPSISGTQCDRGNQFCLQKEGLNQIMMRHKMGTQSDRKSQKWGSSARTLPTIPKYGRTLPGSK